MAHPRSPSLSWLFALALSLLLSSGLGLRLGWAQTLRGEGKFPEVLKAKHRSVEEAKLWLEPFLEPGGSISVVSDQILVRASRANVQKLREVLAGLDRAPVRLQIQMRSLGKSSWRLEAEAEEGRLAVLRTPGTGLLVRARRLPSGVSIEILDPAENLEQESRLIAVVNGRQGQWLPAGAGFEIQVREASR